MKSNKGMSIVELIIAIAMLALIMTAIAGIMSSNTLIFKKQKSDVFVQNTAQETYNRLTDAIMQAKEVEIYGVTVSDTPAYVPTNIGAKKDSISTEYVVIRKTVPDGVTSETVQASDTINNNMIGKSFTPTKFKDYMSMGVAPGGTDLAEYKDVYVLQMKIKYSVPLELAGLPDSVSGDAEFYGADGKFRKDLTDDCTATIAFENNVMKIKLEYDLMQKYNTNDSDEDNLVYTKNINYIVDSGDVAVPGVIAKIDAENESILLDMHFAQKSGEKQKEDGSYPGTGMQYDSVGMINIRNSYVLKDMK